MTKYSLARGARRLVAVIGGGALLGAMTLAPGAAQAQEPPQCLSPDPAMWPPPAKPYFMVAFDTSGSMSDAVATNNSCGYANDRLGHGRCAVKNTFLAFGGEANFGLSSFARVMSNCSAAVCNNACITGAGAGTFQSFTGNAAATVNPNCGNPWPGCGPEPGALADSSTRAGGRVLVPILSDLGPQPPGGNTAELVSWVDNTCTSNKELFASGCTPLNGILRDMLRYYANQWVPPSPIPGGATIVSPLTSVANGERACRSVNVILVTDGFETCDTTANAVDAAADLLAGFTKDGIAWSVKTFVIDFGNAGASADQIAAAGGTVAAQTATDEAQLSAALANIIAGAIKPEICDNTDNNCNGCTDEGSKHYCNVLQTCCAYATPAQRTVCLNSYTASITPADPDGDLTLLPCTTVLAQTQPANWLCFDPKESCDGQDNNCQDGIDENVLKCGNPAHCPLPEICNGLDDDCDGAIDGPGVCIGTCVPSNEVCDGCDNDCDGIADDGAPGAPCGLLTPPNCVGALTCKPAQMVPIPGGCVVGGGFNTCSNNPQPEVCDGIDNDCDGTPDDMVAPIPCVPPGTPGGLIYGGTSQCQMGSMPCGGTCQGFVGPSTEICDGIDNDCDGAVDDNVFGVNNPCGINSPPCTPGTTACVNGALICQGGNGPLPEICDGIDNDCDGSSDEAPLADGPLPGQNGCWAEAGNCCMFQNLTWCPPPGAGCNDVGTLTPPCNYGTLACAGAAGWICQNPKPPTPEACDGLDNNCNGAVDDGNFPQVGQPCGSDIGECMAGALACVAGVIDCVNDVPPTPEVCDGLDNDCDMVIDNGVSTGGPCTPVYDMVAYPGPRDNLPCQPGILQCNGMGGVTCLGGVGPSPEVCDSIDNDCDGSIDEVGAQPDGIDGTANPSPPPDAVIGDICGTSEGQCTEGQYACLNGVFSCIGGQGPTPEQCDCNDNDCNGVVDNEPPVGSLCSPTKDCVSSTFGCQCAAPCSPGEIQCPPGQECQTVTSSETGERLGIYCVVDSCGDCSTKTTVDGVGTVLCAPAGTVLANCVTPPVCACKGQNGCLEPCFGVTCGGGLVCTNYGPNAGQCVIDSCYNVPCLGCGQACHNGSCAASPCAANSCPDGQVCKPQEPWGDGDFVCVASCADQDCPADQECVGGACVPTCVPACPDGQACDLAQSPPVCVADQCDPNPCTDGKCCDPIAGCQDTCPCAGVVCPDGQECKNGDCFEGQGGAGGGTTTSTGTGTGGDVTSSATTGAGTGGAGGTPARGVWGLATGGGGCACEVGARGRAGDARYAAIALAAAAAVLRRRRSRSPKGLRSASGKGEVAR